MESTLIELDLRHRSNLPGSILRRLNDIMVRDVPTFNTMIAALSQGRERDIDWWVSSPATRNNHVSMLHARCTQLALIRELTDAGNSLLVLLDCPTTAAVLRHAAIPNLSIRLEGALKTSLRRLAKQATDIAASAFHCTAAALAAWLTRPAIRATSDRPLTIINTFVSRQSLHEGRFHDRYFPGLIESLSAIEQSCCRYIPVFYRMRDYIGAFRILRRNSIAFLFYEDHLDFADYLFAFGHWWRARKFRGLKAHYAGFEIGPLIDLDARNGRFASIVVRALLAHRFHLRARERGLSFRTVLDWYEGLDYNHAIAAAINWGNSRASITGFRSAGSLYYMSCTPAPHEVAAGVVPSRMAVVGTGLAEEIKTLCPALNVITAPGMRYRRLMTLEREPVDGGAVLVALPLSRALAVDNIRTLAAARRRMASPPRHWWVKSHPALPEDEIVALLGGILPEGFEFVRGDFYFWLARSQLVAGVASSALMESTAFGIPTICLAEGNAPVEVPVPSWVAPSLSRVTYDAQETADAITTMISADNSEVDFPQLHAALLGSVTQPEMRDLLELA